MSSEQARKDAQEAIEANLGTPGDLFLPTEEWNTPKLGRWRRGPNDPLNRF